MTRDASNPNSRPPLQELEVVEAQLQASREELRIMEQECSALREQRRQLIRSLEGQLDLFKDQLSLSEQLLKEVRHG
ncbi:MULTISPECIES: hypothetical protein [Halomonadaceae]|uniref:hypothetical protein n=1 Tax=Halomonadaceae TaxID=28256 RepID=UPI001867B079|nr:hypothetical protein [Halomonas colorata]